MKKLLLSLSAALAMAPGRLSAQEFPAGGLATIDPRSIAADSAGQAPAAVSSPARVNSGDGCPVALEAAVELNRLNGARTLEFRQKITPLLAAGLPDREKIALVAGAAVNCGVHFGSCGKTAETIFEIVGLPARSPNKISISNEQMRGLDALKCLDTVKHDRGCWAKAKRMAYHKLRGELPGWPASYMRELEPGDRMVVFNANSGPHGTHTTIFLRWQSEGTAEVIQGAWGRLVTTGLICVAGCPSPLPLVRVVSALPR